MAMVVLMPVVGEILDVFDAKYYYLFDYVYYFHESKKSNLKKPIDKRDKIYLHFDGEFGQVVLMLCMNNRAHYTKKMHHEFLYLEKLTKYLTGI
jgi:hypothetical protein